MTTDLEAFNANLDAWKKDEGTPWGRLRRSLAFRNLKTHLPAGKLQILDAGGGNGRDSIPLAKCGHRIILLDYSSEMLQDARTKAREEGVEESLFTLHEAEVADIPSLFSVSSHDCVLLHNVLSYVEDPATTLKAATHSLRQDGVLSLMQVNRYSEAMQLAVWDLDLDTAVDRLDARTSTARVFDHVPVQRYAVDELIPLLESTGFRTLQHYGILCVTGYIHDNEIKYQTEFFKKLERLEIAMSTRHPYRLLAKFCHLIAIKS